MNVFVLMKNQYCRHEHNIDTIVEIFSTREAAQANKPADYSNIVEDVSYTIQEYRVSDN